MTYVLTACPEPRCSRMHGVVSDKPRRGPAKPAREPYTGPNVSPRRSTDTRAEVKQ